MKRIEGGQGLLTVWNDRTGKQYSIEASQDSDAAIHASPLTRVAAGGDTVDDQSSRAMGSDSSYYSTLGRAVNGNSATVAAAVGYVSSGSLVVRDKLDSATLRIPGWSLGVPSSMPSNSNSSNSGDVLDQLGSVKVPDVDSQPAATTTAAGPIDSSSTAQVQSSGSSDVADQLGLVRVAASGI